MIQIIFGQNTEKVALMEKAVKAHRAYTNMVSIFITVVKLIMYILRQDLLATGSSSISRSVCWSRKVAGAYVVTTMSFSLLHYN